MRSVTCALLLGAIVVFSGGVSAQSITSPPNFLSNNGGSPGGAVYFDVTVLAGGGLQIQSFDSNCTAAAGTSVTLDVYTTPGTSIGVQTNMAAWTLQGSATAPSLGQNMPTPFDTGDFVLPAGNYGMAIVNSGGHRYTNGTGANQAVANAEMSLTFGQASNVAFTGALFDPRVWNGTIYYAPNANILALQQSGPGIGDLAVSLTMIAPTATEGFTLLSTDTSLAQGEGLMLGITPVSLTWDILGYAYFPGNPFHFMTSDPAPFFPGAAFVAPPGSVTALAGQTMDFVCLMINASGGLDGQSNVVRLAFQ